MHVRCARLARTCRLLRAVARSSSACSRPAALVARPGCCAGQQLFGCRAAWRRGSSVGALASAGEAAALAGVLTERCPGCGVRLQEDDPDRPGRVALVDSS